MRVLRIAIALPFLLCPGLAAATPDGVWTEQRPLRRAAHAAVHDALRDRMILVGGVIENFNEDPGYDGSTSDVWVLDLANPAAWTRLAVAGTPPPPRFAPAVIHDAVRDRIVMWGGKGAADGEVWVLTLSGTPSWSVHATGGTPPGPRHAASAAYDPVRDQLVVFGGYDAAGAHRADVWTLALGAGLGWTQQSPAGPPPAARAFGAFAYDPPRDRFVLVGGECAQPPVYRADVWTLELSGTPSWTQQAVTGGPPAARTRASIVHAPATDRFIVFGGYHDYVYLADLWALSFAGAPAWSPIAPAGAPPSARDAHAAIYDPLRNRMTVQGGTTFYGGDEGWMLDLAGAPAWSPLPLPFARPDARRGASVIEDRVNGRLVVFGGGAPNNETWVLPLGGALEWSRLTTGGTAPPARRFHSAVLDPVRRRMIVFGGLSSAGISLNDVWALPLDGAPNWVQLLPTGSKPAVRNTHAAVYSAAGDRMVIFGGANGASDHSDVFALSLGTTPAWTKLFPSGGTPAARSGAAATYDPAGARMVIYGGFSQGSLEYQGDTWALTLGATPAWVPVQPASSGPPPRAETGSAHDVRRNRLVVFGGAGSAFGASGRTNEVWAMDLGTNAWSPLAPGGFVPARRSGGFAAYDSLADRLVVYSGFMGFEFSDVNWTLDFADVTLGVPRGAGADFALHGTVPNPVRGDLVVAFRLPDAAPARLELFDVAGRRIDSQAVGALGAGFHTTTLARARALAPGIYLLRLTRGGEHRIARAAVLR